MKMSFIILLVSSLLFGCSIDNSKDPWKGNLYLAENGEIKNLDPTKEKLYSSQGSEELNEVIKKMPYKVKLPTDLTFEPSSIWASIKLVGTQDYDGINQLGNDQALEIFYINHKEEKVVQLQVDRFKIFSLAPNLKYAKSTSLKNGADTWYLKSDKIGGTLQWRQDNLNYEMSGNITEEEFIKIANSLEYPQ